MGDTRKLRKLTSTQRLVAKRDGLICLRAAIAMLIFCLANAGEPLKAQTLNSQELYELRGFTERGCFIDQKSRRLNSGISDRAIETYCQCYAAELYPISLTVQQLLQAKNILESRGDDAMVSFLLMGRNIYDVANYCTQQALLR